MVRCISALLLAAATATGSVVPRHYGKDYGDMGENVQQVQGVNYVPLQVETVPYATAPYNRVPTVTCTVTETVTVACPTGPPTGPAQQVPAEWWLVQGTDVVTALPAETPAPTEPVGPGLVAPFPSPSHACCPCPTRRPTVVPATPARPATPAVPGVTPARPATPAVPASPRPTLTATTPGGAMTTTALAGNTTATPTAPAVTPGGAARPVGFFG